MRYLALFLFLFVYQAYGAAFYTSFSKAVATSGTRETLTASSVYTSHVVIQAAAGNTGAVYLGGDDVAAANGYVLNPGDEVKLGDLIRKHSNEVIDLNKVYIDAATNGNSVIVLHVKNRYKGGQPSVQ